jgi:Kef-type K+ transport system membrane component KefB
VLPTINDPVVIFALVTLLILGTPFAMAKIKMPGMVGLLLAGALLGPNALGLLERDSSFILLGKVGLIYIMFTAALEVDLGVFKRYRVHAGVFGVLTFAFPQVIGSLAAFYILGFDWPAAILLASLFASHTLLAYPVASRLGLAKSQAVTTAVGGTMVTDTAALLVLAVVAGTAQGELNEAFWWRLGVSLAVYVTVIFFGVPRAGRWLFKRVGDDGAAQFVFVLATVFTCAALAHAAGVEDIVGAFLAGLALNRLIPHNSTLMNRIVFTGEAIFVPFFLISVGMLVDARVLFGGLKTWLVAFVMIGSVLLTKWIAAHATRPFLKFDGDEAQMIFGLSVAQAAATLAAVMVGHQLWKEGKLLHFDETVVNGSIVMILVTCTIAPVLVDRFGRKVAARKASEEVADPGAPPQRILLPLREGTAAQSLIDLAILLREEGQGQPLYMAHATRDDIEVADSIAKGERMLSHAIEHASAAEVPVHPLTRVDAEIGPALVRARKELRITHLILGWDGQPSAHDCVLGSVTDPVLADGHATVLLARLTHQLGTTTRVTLAIPPGRLEDPSLPEALSAIKRIAAQTGAPLTLLVEREEMERAKKLAAATKPSCKLELHPLESWGSLNQALVDRITEHDLVVLYGIRPSGTDDVNLARSPLVVAARFPEVNLLVVYGPTATTTQAAASTAWLMPRHVQLGLAAQDLPMAIHGLVERALPPDQRVADLPVPIEALVRSARPLAPGVLVLNAWWNAVRKPTVLVGVLPHGLPPTVAPMALVVLLSGDGHEPHWQFDVMADVTRRLNAEDVAARLLGATDPRAIVDLLSKVGGESSSASTMIGLPSPGFRRDQPAGSSVGIAPGVSSGHHGGPTGT